MGVSASREALLCVASVGVSLRPGADVQLVRRCMTFVRTRVSPQETRSDTDCSTRADTDCGTRADTDCSTRADTDCSTAVVTLVTKKRVEKCLMVILSSV